MPFAHDRTSLTVERQVEALAAIDLGVQALRRGRLREARRCFHAARAELRRANLLLVHGAE